MRAIVFVGALFSLASCSDARPPSLSVGYQTIVIEDTARADPAASDMARIWVADIFYPSQGGGNASTYASSPEWTDALVRAEYYGQDEAALRTWSEIPESAHYAATPSADTARPLLLLSPGMGVARLNYRMLAARLVESGFIVAVIDHPYLGFSLKSDGTVSGPDDLPGLAEAGPDEMGGFVSEWAADYTPTLNAILDQTEALGIDVSRIAAAGHSLGGAVALDACRVETRITVCMNFEGAPFGTQTLDAGPGAATLMVLSAPRHEGEEAEARAGRGTGIRDMNLAMLSQGDAPAWFVSVTGGGHMSFSDAPIVMPGTLTAFGGEVMTADRSFDVYTGLVSAFTQAYWPDGGGDVGFAAYLEGLPEAGGWQAD